MSFHSDIPVLSGADDTHWEDRRVKAGCQRMDKVGKGAPKRNTCLVEEVRGGREGYGWGLRLFRSDGFLTD
jgi:hypothetical protein